MKKINFGYSNENNPHGSHEGIGASPNYDIIGAEFIDFVQLDNSVYLISRVGMVFKGQEDKIGTIDVREVIADMYNDGSGVIFADQEKSDICRILESSLSNADDYIKKGVKVHNICGGSLAPDNFKLLLDVDSMIPLVVTGIKHDIFEEKKKLLSNCRHSFSEDYQNVKKSGRSF